MEIEKIYRQLDNYHNQLNANKEKFEKIYNENTSSITEIRNIILTIFTILAGFSGFTFAITAITDLNYSSIVFLIFFVIVAIFVYYIFHIIKSERNKKVLEILNEFHDGFTTISFMKGFLDNISLLFENLEPKQINVLADYYTMVQGGIAFKIRSQIQKSVKGGGIAFQIRRIITESVKEAATYGEIERKLYDMLIYNASKIYKVQKETKKETEEDNLLKQLFHCRNKKYDSLPLKTKIFDEYKKVLENKFLIIGASVENQKGMLGKIVKVDDDEVDNGKSYCITIEGRGHGINKKYRVDNPTNGSKNSSEREEHWLKSLLDWRHWRHHYKIPLEPDEIEGWEYLNLNRNLKLNRNPLITKRDYSKRIDGKELKQKEIDDTAKAIEDTE